jgi:hypothetical protein
LFEFSLAAIEAVRVFSCETGRDFGAVGVTSAMALRNRENRYDRLTHDVEIVTGMKPKAELLN